MSKKAVRQSESKEFLLTRQQMAACWSVRPEHFDKNYRPLIPAELVVRKGRRIYFQPEANRVLADLMVERAEAEVQAADGDPLMVGSDGGSDGLERYRQAKAGKAEIELQEMRGELIRTSNLEQLIGVLAARIRSAGGMLKKKFGDEAARVIDEALDDAEQEIEARFGSTE